MLDFAPDEACRSGCVAAAEAGSYPAVSPLPGNCQAVYFLLRCLSKSAETTLFSRELPGIMSCGARTFLRASIHGRARGGGPVHRKYSKFFIAHC